MNALKINALTWMALLSLCLVSFLGRRGVALLLAAAGLKAAILGWRFMELHAAHWVWRVLVLGQVVILLGILRTLLARAA